MTVKMKDPKLKNLPIGVFDSGVGGLTVLKALIEKFPEESFIYLADTARLPYGTKDPETITQYANIATRFLAKRGIKMLVVACNTVSSTALETIKNYFSPLPVIGVLEPGAEAACEISSNGKIAVIATEATVKTNEYQKAIKKIRPNAEIIAKSCGLFVPLVEEGFIEGPVTEAAIKYYLTEFLSQPTFKADCLVLGCTHYPVLLPAIKKIINSDIKIVDSAQTTAAVVEKILNQTDLATHHNPKPTLNFLVTDGPQRFAKIAQLFLGQSLTDNKIELVGL